jgi:hypothetical protein
MRLLPGPLREGLLPIWRERIVAPGEVDWGSAGDRPKSSGGSYDAYLDSLVDHDSEISRLRDHLYAALTDCDQEEAGRLWDAVAAITGGVSWRVLGDPYDTVRALGALATVRRNRITVQTKIDVTNLPHLVNSLLLEPKERRGWSHAFKTLARVQRPELLSVASIARKIERNLSEGHPYKEVQAGPVFNVLFPEGAFQRLRMASGSHIDVNRVTSGHS